MKRDSFNSPGSYPVEVSGWGLDGDFFVEKAELVWTPAGEKSMQLRRALAEGAVVFILLLRTESLDVCFPVAYTIKEAELIDCHGRCRMTLAQLDPRVRVISKESIRVKSASNEQEDVPRKCDALQGFESLAGEGIFV